jgi:predicted transposase YbfD/YdcC
LFRKKITPDRLLCFRLKHWGIEIGLHYRRDVTFKEDATRMAIDNTDKVMASINNLAIALTHQANFRNAAQARQWFADQLSDAFALLTTSFL